MSSSPTQKHLHFKEKPPCLYLLQEAETGSGEVLETCPFTEREPESSQGGMVGLSKVAGTIGGRTMMNPWDSFQGHTGEKLR